MIRGGSLNFFDFSRELRAFKDIKYLDKPASESDVRAMEAEFGMKAGVELELYLRNIGSIRRNGAWFFSLDYMRFMMKILKTVQSAGRYFIVGYFGDGDSSCGVVLVDETDRICLYDIFKSCFIACDKDLFAYILDRLSESDV